MRRTGSPQWRPHVLGSGGSAVAAFGGVCERALTFPVSAQRRLRRLPIGRPLALLAPPIGLSCRRHVSPPAWRIGAPQESEDDAPAAPAAPAARSLFPPEVQARPRSPVGIASAACYAEPAGGRGRPRLLDGAGGPCHGVFSAQCRAQIVARRFARCRSPWRTESWVCSVPLSFESGVPRARCVADACSPAGSRTTDHRARRTICQLCDDSEDINRSTCVLCEAHYFNTFS